MSFFRHWLCKKHSLDEAQVKSSDVTKGRPGLRDQGIGSHHSRHSNQKSIPYDLELVGSHIAIEGLQLGDYFSSALVDSCRATPGLRVGLVL